MVSARAQKQTFKARLPVSDSGADSSPHCSLPALQTTTEPSLTLFSERSAAPRFDRNQASSRVGGRKLECHLLLLATSTASLNLSPGTDGWFGPLDLANERVVPGGVGYKDIG